MIADLGPAYRWQQAQPQLGLDRAGSPEIRELRTQESQTTIYQACRIIPRTMNAVAGVGPSQPRIPFSYGSRPQQRRKAKAKARGKEKEQPQELWLPASPSPKAVTPITVKNESEDLQTRFLIYHCKPPLEISAVVQG